MLNLPVNTSQLTGPVTAVVLAVLLYLLEPLSHEHLAFTREAMNQSEWWRLLTANLLHTNLNHLLLNLAGVFLLWSLHGDFYDKRNYLTVLVLSGISSTIGVWLFAPELSSYVGLSGALHGMFIWGAGRDIQRGYKTGWLLLLGIVGKIYWEQTQGAADSVVELINAQVAVDAHLFGAIAGGLILVYELTKAHLSAKNR